MCRRRNRSSPPRRSRQPGLYRPSRRLRRSGTRCVPSARRRHRRTHSSRFDGHGRRHRNRRLNGGFAFKRLLESALTNGEQRERVDVSVLFGGETDAEMHVRLRPFGVSARSDRSDDLALDDRGSDAQRDRPEVDKGDRIPVLRADRQAAPFAREPAGERDDPGHRRAHVGSRRRTDVDAAMLTACVRVVLCGERPEHRPVDGPCPSGRARSVSKCDEQHRPEDEDFVARLENHVGRVSSRSAVVKSAYREAL